MSYEITIEHQLDNGDLIDLEIEYTVHWGYPAHGPTLSGPGEPAEEPEIEILGTTPDIEWELPDALYETFLQSARESDYP